MRQEQQETWVLWYGGLMLRPERVTTFCPPKHPNPDVTATAINQKLPFRNWKMFQFIAASSTSPAAHPSPSSWKCCVCSCGFSSLLTICELLGTPVIPLNMGNTILTHFWFPTKSTGWYTIFLKFCLTQTMHCIDDAILPHFVVFSGYNSLISSHSYPPSPSTWSNRFLLNLLIPGPDINSVSAPTDFKSRSGLGVLNLNVWSLMPKLDLIKIWVNSTNTDILVLSGTWLKKSITNKDIAIKGHNVYRCDCPRKGGGIALYIKQKCHVTVQSSLSLNCQFEFLALVGTTEWPLSPL